MTSTDIDQGRPLALQQFFRGRQLALTLAVLIVALVMIRLGFWQLQRRAERLAINAMIASRTTAPPLLITGRVNESEIQEYRPVEVRGTFDYEHEIILRNRARQGATGSDILTPLRIAGSDQAVLVDRGWVPYGQEGPTERVQFRAGDTATVTGLLRTAQTRTSWASPADPPLTAERPRLDAWFRADIARIQEQTPYPLLPFYIEASPTENTTGPPWPQNQGALDEGPHLSYALQWFAFSAILLVGYVVRALRGSQSLDRE